ncbi:MAG: nuclear transport factor 2 family protein [bacterium]
MKRTVFLGACSLGLSVLLLSGCQPAANTNQAVVTTAPSPERVDTASIQTEIMRIENDWPRVVKERDVAAVERVEADDAVFIYPDGSLGNKAQDVKDMQTGALTADSWVISDLTVTVLDADSAFASGRSTVTNGKYKMPDGKTMDISGDYRYIDTFARRNGEWKLVAAASVRVQKQAMASPSPAMTASPAMAASPKASPATKPSPAMTHTPAVKASPAVTP